MYSSLGFTFRFSYIFKGSHDGMARGSDIHAHKSASALAKQNAGTHAHTGFMHKELLELRVAPLEFTAIKP